MEIQHPTRIYFWLGVTGIVAIITTVLGLHFFLPYLSELGIEVVLWTFWSTMFLLLTTMGFLVMRTAVNGLLSIIDQPRQTSDSVPTPQP